jgi:hypothetical protein
LAARKDDNGDDKAVDLSKRRDRKKADTEKAEENSHSSLRDVQTKVTSGVAAHLVSCSPLPDELSNLRALGTILEPHGDRVRVTH